MISQELESMTEKLPTVIFTQVVRASKEGDSHGKVYLLDLESEKSEEVIDWRDKTINWQGRGGNRGLRGIVYYEDKVLIAASRRVIVYDKNFNQVSEIENPYLASIHEISIEKDILAMSSTEYDSVVLYDLKNECFLKSYCFRAKPKSLVDRFFRSLLGKYLYKKTLLSENQFNFFEFDPMTDDGPVKKDTTHLNSIYSEDGYTYFCGAFIDRIYRVKDGVCEVFGNLPRGTHSARPFNGNVICCDTRNDNVLHLKRDGSIIDGFDIPTSTDEEIEVDDAGKQVARAGFARGLTVWGEYLFAGVAPASIYVYKFGNPEPIKRIRVKDNIRYAVHGLEVWE